MPTDQPPPEPDAGAATPKAESERRPLPSAAERALVEAAARRAERGRNPPNPKEADGRGGPEPTRYGDWEVNGLASDF